MGEGSHIHRYKLWERGSKWVGSQLWAAVHTWDKERYNSPMCLVKLQPSRLMFSNRACRVSRRPDRLPKSTQHTHILREWMHTCYTPTTAACSYEREHSEVQQQAKTAWKKPSAIFNHSTVWTWWHLWSADHTAVAIWSEVSFYFGPSLWFYSPQDTM